VVKGAKIKMKSTTKEGSYKEGKPETNWLKSLDNTKSDGAVLR